MSEIQRYLSKDNSDPENYKSLIPEVANLLNVSVSTIENYPSDIQKALCDIYVDYYRSDEITVKQALKRVVQLNSETENQIEKSNYETSQKEQESSKKLSAQSLLSREQIARNAKAIHERNKQNVNYRDTEYGLYEERKQYQ